MIDRVLLREQESALSESQHRRSGRIEAVRAGVALDASWRVAAAECARLRCVVAEAKRASHVADSGGGGNHAAVCSELRSAEAREVELHKLLAASLCEMGALIHEWAPATLESRPSALPTAAPFGALGNHGGNSHIALRLAARRGYELLPCALHADPGRSSKLEKLRRTRGESGPLARGESDPRRALHACDWMPRVDLPRRYAQLVPVTDAAGTVHSELRLCELEQPLGVATLRGTLFVAEPKRMHVFAPDGSPCKGCAPRWPGCVAHVGVHGDNLYLSDPLSMRVHRLAIRGA